MQRIVRIRWIITTRIRIVRWGGRSGGRARPRSRPGAWSGPARPVKRPAGSVVRDQLRGRYTHGVHPPDMSIVALALFAIPFALTAALSTHGVSPYIAAVVGWLVLIFISWCFAKDG